MLVVALALRQIAAELAADRAAAVFLAADERALGMRDEQRGGAAPVLAEPVAARAGADVRVEREVARLERLGELEAALRAGAVGAVLEARGLGSLAGTRDDAHATAGDGLGLLDGLHQARAHVRLEGQAIEHEVDALRPGRERRGIVQAALDAVHEDAR